MLFSLNTGLIQDQAKPVACEKSVDIDITIEDFERQFRSLQKEILSQLVKRGVDPATMINSLTLLPLKLRKEYEKAIQELLPSLSSKCKEGIDKLFFHLNHLFSFLDYGLLEYIIKEYGSDTLKQDMTTYSSDICIFMKETTIKQLVDHLPGQIKIPPNFSLIEAKIGEDASKCTLEQLNKIRKRYCSEIKLSDIVFHLVAVVESNSFIVRWLVPSVFVDDVVKSTRNVDQSFYQEYRITSLTLDGMWLFLSDTEIDVMWSKMRVGDTEFSDQFHIMHEQILYELDGIGRSTATDKLSSYLMDQQPTLQQDVSVKISEAILSPNFPISVIDFRMLIIIIELFGSDCLKRVMESYCHSMSTFVKQSTLEQLIDFPPIQSRLPENFLTAECKIKGKPFEYGLEKLLEFQARFCSMVNIDKICFVMGEVRKEVSRSFTVRWYIPSAAAVSFMKFTRNNFKSFYQEYQITSLTLDGMWIQLSDAEIDAMWSRLHVSDTNYKVQFHAMYKQIVYEIEVVQLAGHELSSHIRRSLECHRSTSDWLSRELLNHKLPVSVVDFRVLAAAIEGFGSDCLKSVMSSYCKYISSLTKKSTAQQLLNLSAVQLQPSGYSIVKCRIKKKPSQYKLEKLFSFRTGFCTIAGVSEICFIMDEVTIEVGGSFTVSWLVPPSFFPDIMQSSRNFDHSLHHRSNIISLTLDGMWLYVSKSEIDAMWSQVHVSDTKFKNQFRTICKQILHEMKMQNVSKDHLSTYFQSLKFNYQQQEVDQLCLTVLEGEFPSSYVDFGVLKAVIEEFGSDCLKRVMRSYCNYMSIFTKQSTVQQLINLSVLQSKHWKHFVVAKCTIMKEPSHYKVKKLLQFRTRLCAIARFDEACFIINEINNMEVSGSFIVSWLVPSALAHDIIAKCDIFVDQSFYQEYRITSLTLDGIWLFLSEAEIDAMWSKMRVGDTEFNDQFHIMHTQTLYEVDGIGRSTATDKLSSYLMDQQPTLQQDVSVKISEAILSPNFPISVIDFRMLTIVIKLFGSNCLKRVMESYCHFMSTFVKQTTIQQIIDLSPIQSQVSESFFTAECKIMGEPFEYELEKFLKFQTEFCSLVNIDKVCFVMGEVRKRMNGSFIVSWHIPSAAVSYLVKFTRNIFPSSYQEYKIASLTLDGMWLFLSEAEIDAMWSKMHVGDTEFSDQFHIMHTQALYELDRIGRSTATDKLSSYLMDQQPTLQQDVSVKISEAILSPNFPISVIDFRMLTIVIELFGSDCLKRVMESYCHFMSTFIKQTSLEQIIDLSPIQSQVSEGFFTAECKIIGEPFEYELEKFLKFQTELCSLVNIDKVCFVMGEVRKRMNGSFIFSWHVPSTAVSYVVKFIRNTFPSFYQEYKVASLTLNGMWLFLSEAEIDAMWSQMHVCDTEFNDQFHIMHTQALYKVDRIGRSTATDKLSSYLMDQQPTLQQDVSVKISEAILSPNFPISVIDFRMLAIVIELFGSDCLKRVMEFYCHFMSTFVKQTTLEQIIDLSPIQSQVSEGFFTAECKIIGEPFEYELEKLLKFQAEFCSLVNIDKVCFVMGEVCKRMNDSFIVSWHIPSGAVSYIVKFTRNIFPSFYQEYKVASLTLDGMWLFLSGAEIDVLWHPSHFESQFLTMYRQIVRALKVQEISGKKLSIYLMDQQPKLQSNASIELSEAFLEHAFPLSVLDFRVLSIVINKFGNDCLKSVMKSFQKYVISMYTRDSTVEQLVSLPPIPSQFSKYFVSVESRNIEDPSNCKLAKLLDFQAKFCTSVNIEEVCFIMDKIKAETGGSFIAKWHVLSSLASELISANQLDLKLFQEMNIPSLRLGGMWLYNYQLSPIAIQLKKRYQQSQGSPSPVEWIPSPTKKIFRLAMIQRERVQQGHIEDRLVRMTISGRVDDILHAKSPVELEHIFRNTLHGGEIILIEGAPGSGKSTLTVHICQRWGKGQLFQQFTVVILIQLRDPAVQRAQSIVDLLPVENAEEIAVELIATNGRGILWVLDGWDELPPHLQQNSIFYQLIKRMLSECSVIVTSRPVSSGDLHPVVSSRIEVLGFTPEELRQYFTECLKGDTKALEALLEKIQENPVVQSICYLPLNAAFIVQTFKYRDQSLPNTEYEIYLSVIFSCIQRHYDREGRGHDLPRELASLDDLSRIEAVREPFQCLCELAYRGVMENKLTFSSSDLPQGSNTLSLLQAIESFLQSGKSVFYNFLHLSIQEVLSAYYITTKLSESEQVSQFQQLFNQPRFAAVFQFYAAITKLKSPGIHQVIDRIVEAKSKPLLVSLLRCLHEAQDPALCLYVVEGLEYKLNLSETSLSPLDCLSVSLFISFIAGKKITIDLAQCQISDLGAKCLTKYLSMSSYTDLVISSINLKGNDIHDEGAAYITKIFYLIELPHLDISENPIGVTGTSYMFQAVRESVILKTLILFGGTIIDDLLSDNNVENALDITRELQATNGYGVLWILDDPQPHLHTVLLSPKLTSSYTECSIIVTSRHTIDKIFKDKSKPLLVSLLRCLHEAQDPALCLYVAERLEYRLDLSDTSLSPLDCLSLSFFLFCLYGCTSDDLGAQCLSKYLHIDYHSKYVSRISIDLAKCKLHEEDTLHIIARILHFIEHLYLSGNLIGDTGASLISEAVRETATLKTLVLYNCRITSRGAEDLSRALAQSSSLEKLDIGLNNLGDKGISHVAEALKQNKQLKELWISNCEMTDKGAASLASALTVNNSLKMLYMGGYRGEALTEDGLSTIAHSLANKPTFVKLAIPYSFAIFLLSREVNEVRKKNGLPPIEIIGECIILCGQCFYVCQLH